MRSRFVIGPVVALVLAAGALAGCGSDASSPGTTTTPASAPPTGAPQPGAEQRAAIEKLRTCLKEQGVDLPSGGPGGPPPSAGGAPPALDREALQACAEYLPQGGPPAMGAPPGSSS